jgi:hypothetical protein
MVQTILTESSAGSAFRSIGAIAKDPVTSELYVVDVARRVIDVIDTAGVPRFSFVHWIADSRTGERRPGEPHALVATLEGQLFVTDYFSRVIDVLNIRGERIGSIDVLSAIGWNDPGLRPEKLALDSRQRLYVSIAGTRSGVVRCLPDGSGCELLIDATADSVATITGMGVAPDGRVGLLDFRGEPAARIYSPDGAFLFGFAGHDVEEADLSYPSAFLFAEDGTYWIADALRHAVKHYSAKGEYLDYIGGYSAAPGGLRYPTALAGNGVNAIYVAERVGRRVQAYVLPGAPAIAATAQAGTEIDKGSEQ